MITKRRDCRLCGGSAHDLILPLAPTPIADAYLPASRSSQAQPVYPLDLYLCKSCGHSQLLDVIDPETLYRDYIYVTTSSLGLSDHFGKYSETVLSKLRPKPASLVIDVGSNDGTLLRHFKSHGMKVLGVEPAREIARAATQGGVETVPEFFTSELAAAIRKSHGPAEIITMNNLFANIDHLQDTVNGIRGLLSPTGVFVFETFYFADYIRNMVFDFMYHEHLSYFSVRPLQAFFERHGLQLIDIDRVSTKGGSIRGYVQLAGAKRPVAPVVSQLAKEEAEMGLHQSGKLFEDYRLRIATEKRKLKAAVSEILARGGTVAGYGASATTTTLLYHFELTDSIRFIADDNESRQGTLSPGCHIPIVSSDELLRRKPDAVVMFAWRYDKPILKRNQAYLDAGGKFLIPLPEFREA